MSAVPTELTRRLLVTIETITPADAEHYLTLNENPRRIRPAKVKLYARDIARGNWEVGTSALKFDVQGRLRDGQHRLAACVEAATPFTTVVYRNVTDAAVDNTDRGMTRLWADVLHGRGYANAHHLQAAVVVGWRWDLNGWSGRLQPSISECDDWLAENSLMPECVSVANALGQRLGAKRSTLAAFLNRASAIDPDEVDRFVEALRSGANLEATNPAFRLRERWMLNRHVRPTSSLGAQLVELAYICKAWNAWIEGRPITQLVYRYSANEKFPDLVDGEGRVQPFPDVIARQPARAVEKAPCGDGTRHHGVLDVEPVLSPLPAGSLPRRASCLPPASACITGAGGSALDTGGGCRSPCSLRYGGEFVVFDPPALTIGGTPAESAVVGCSLHLRRGRSRRPSVSFTGERRDSLPRNWKAIRRAVFARDGGRCVWCGARATDVDHIGDRNDHSLPNLRSLCGPCHRHRTGKQGAAALAAARRARKVGGESHPGLIPRPTGVIPRG